MKKKTVGSIAILVAVLLLIVGGIWFAVSKMNASKTGNRLNVSWYSETGKEFTITTANELYELAELSDFYNFKDQTINLGADIIVNEGDATQWAEKAPSRKWKPINGFAGTFDGQGHTISGIYATGFDREVALFTNTTGTAVVQDLQLVNSYFKTGGYDGVASIASNGGGTFKKIYADTIIDHTGDFCGGMFSKLVLKSTIEECWFEGDIRMTGRTGGGIIDAVLGSQVTMEHCLFSGTIDGKWDYSGSRIGGLVGMVYQSGAKLALNDSLSTGKIEAVNVYYVGSAIGASYGGTALESEAAFGSMGSYDVVIGRSGENGTFRGAPMDIRENDLIGDNAYRWTNLDFDKYWTTVEDDTPILQYFADEVKSVAGLQKAYNLDWYDETKSTYVIDNLEDLYGLRMISAQTDFAGKTVKLGADIKVNEGTIEDWLKEEPVNPWYPLGTFAGTFDGQGHTISGIFVKNGSQQIGFFKKTLQKSTVKNFNLKDSYFHHTGTGTALMGAISGRGGGTFDTIYSNATLVSSGTVNGGIIGQINELEESKITNCWFDGSVSLVGKTGRYGGGIVGNVVKGKVTIEHCLNTGTISSDYENGGVFVGGITSVAMNAGTRLTITDCLNTGKIETVYDVCVGAIIGRIPQGPTVSISDTYATSESYQHPTNGFMGVGNQSVTTYKGGVADYPAAKISGYGGYQWTTLNFSDYWAAVVKPDGTPVLKSFASSVPSLSGIAKKVDTSWYSADATEYVIDSVADLYGLYIVAAANLEGKTVKLGADIAVNAKDATSYANSAPDNVWSPIRSFSGIFDGQGHTISGLYVNDSEGYAGLFARTTESSVIKNLSVKNSYFKSTADLAAMGSVVGQFAGTLDGVYSNAILESTGTQIGGLIGRVNSLENKYKATYKITNCWFDGTVTRTSETAEISYIGGIAGGLIQGTLNMDNCLNTGTITYKYDKLPVNSKGKTQNVGVHVGGLLGGVMNGLAYREDGSVKMISQWNVSDSLNNGDIISGTKDGKIKANGAGAVFGYTTKGTVNIKNVYTTLGKATRIMQYNTDTATVTGNVLAYEEDTISGALGYQYTSLDFNKYWAAVLNPDETPVLKKFASAAPSMTGERADTSVKYNIANSNDLYVFAAYVNGGKTYEGETVKVTATIDVNPGWTATVNAAAATNQWTPANGFAGTFDGQMNVIQGIYVNTDTSYAGLFGQTGDACVIKNLKLQNSYFKSMASLAALGSIAGQLSGVMDTVYSNAIVESTGTQVGGMVGRLNSTDATYKATYTVTNCQFDGQVLVESEKIGEKYAGGIAGALVQGTANISHTLNAGEVTYTYHVAKTSNPAVRVGGLIGGQMGTNRDKDHKNGEFITISNITDSLNTGDILTQKKKASASDEDEIHANGVGSIIGYVPTAKSNVSFVYATPQQAGRTVYSTTANKDNITGSVAVLSEDQLSGFGGWHYTNLTEAFWTVVTEPDDTPILKSFASKIPSVAGLWRLNTNLYNEETGVYEIDSIDKMYGFMSLVNGGDDFAGKTVKLTANIDLNEGWVPAVNAETGALTNAASVVNTWTPIGTSSAPFKGFFDGNGKKISGVYVNWTGGTSNAYVGLFGHVVDATIKDFTLENSYFTGNATAMGAVVGNGDGTVAHVKVNDSVYINSGSQTVGGIIAAVSDRTSTASTTTIGVITNCWFDGKIWSSYSANSYAGGIAGYLVHGNTYLYSCLYTGSINHTCTSSSSKQYARVGGLVARSNTNATVAFSNCFSDGSLTVTTSGAGTQIGAIIGCVSTSATYKDTYGTSDTASKLTGAAGKDYQLSSTYRLADNVFYKENIDTNAITLDFTTYWELRDGATPVLKYFVNPSGIPQADKGQFEHAGSEADPYPISNLTDLQEFVSVINGGETFEGRAVQLRDNITLNEGTLDSTRSDWATFKASLTDWVPIGTDIDHAFKGTFDGNGKTISGLYTEVTTQNVGLFGYIENATIKNLRLTNSYFKTNKTQIGSIAGYGDGVLENIYSDATVCSTNARVGGLIGAVQDLRGGTTNATANTKLQIINCCFDGTIDVTYSGNAAAGGLVGYILHGTTEIYNSLFVGKISCASGTKRVGGFCGQDNSNVALTIANSVSAGTYVTNESSGVGTVLGYVRYQPTITAYHKTGTGLNYYGEIDSRATTTNISVTDISTDTLTNLNTTVTTNNNSSSKLADWDTWTALSDGVLVLTSFKSLIEAK